MGDRRSMSRKLLALTFLLTMTAGSLAVASPASATMFVVNQKFDFPFTDDFSDCGIAAIHVDGHFFGSFNIRTGTGDLAGAFFLHQNETDHETWTNTDNGKVLHFDSHDLVHDVKATPTADPAVFQFVTNVTGQPFVISDMNGKVVMRDRGNLSETYLFDTGGDQVPGGQVIEGSEVFVAHGPHPGFFLDDAGFCAVVASLIG